MTTIVTRAAKGSRLTWGEVDANFTNLNADKVETINPTSSGTLTHSGDIVLSGSGKRITGDFSNATIANRVMFQTSTVNGSTGVFVAPNGTGTASFWLCSNSSSVNNSSIAYIGADPSQVSFQSDKTGTGAYLPMTFYTGGSERMRIGTDGSTTFNSMTNFVSDISLTTGTDQYLYFDGALHLAKIGTGERLVIDANGNVLVTNAGGGLGYGAGAGGVVTQATSKSTAVTLNKPTGQITMNNAALAAGASVAFFCNCSVVGAYDAIQANIVATQYSNYSIKSACDSGHIYFILTNTSAGSLSDAVQIQFAIIKGTNV